MNATRHNILSLIGFGAFLCASISLGSPYQDPETTRAMAEVVKIAHAISIVQPRLEEPKYFEYALGIHNASRRYDIRPALIIAIAQQESSFKERLPEGKAGEIGITQVLKSWLKNPKFRREFPNATTQSLKKPAFSFAITAWILHELKQSEAPGTLPFWSFYNARKFKHRIKYFMRVNKHMAKLKRNLHLIEQALDPANPARPVPSATFLAYADKLPAKPKAPAAKPVPMPAPVASAAKPIPATTPTPVRSLAKAEPKPVPSYPWIETVPPSRPKPNGKRDPRAALLRAASLGG